MVVRLGQGQYRLLWCRRRLSVYAMLPVFRSCYVYHTYVDYCNPCDGGVGVRMYLYVFSVFCEWAD